MELVGRRDERAEEIERRRRREMSHGAGKSLQ